MTQVYNIAPFAKRMLIVVPIWMLCISILLFLTKAFYDGGLLIGIAAFYLMAFPYAFGVIANTLLAWSWPLYFAVLFQIIIWFVHHWENISLLGVLNPRAWCFHVLMTLIMAITAWSRRQIPWRLQMLWRPRE